ncbi:mannose-1-phosphate guanylyltransferase/mannose-6-phosphate isomerase [Limnohabitans sp. MMS-10A-178]|uniref:mannose-1-phosphate guanylyltransferase/mannose-6-phosphate isomerase n=1 Tax=Limnohabitans sp. MMS-10A-178 TaxID=1835767 RepID=UPI000D3DBCA6|nr:mannose-1-phosphate guanylyltransferase/mannose-6-phosphate isomerase [Limnohabitans sp. MMS-10A-178]PUE16063.1 mannose-1-phosphate guanylyltransferase/mannose-6-phosphate isomerase [Limnohabitans sp. MMS-10A-178]
MRLIQSIVMAGGSGTRLWPLSRAAFPKQFLTVSGEHSLLQLATQRMRAVCHAGDKEMPTIVVANEGHRFMVQEQLQEIGINDATILLEPEGRNTAPALTLAALEACKDGDDPILVVTPADQGIKDEQAFSRAMALAIDSAANGHIVVLGVQPLRPETGFGYILAPGNEDVRIVQAFVEKPSVATAELYLEDGNYYWNGGIFVLKASVWLSSLRLFREDIHHACQLAWASRQVDEYFLRLGKSEFLNLPSESIDYAVIEKCPNSGIPISMVPLDAGWSDLGAWDAIWQYSENDDYGNNAQGDVLFVHSHNSLVRSDNRLVAVLGLNNVVVVETDDAVLVANREQSQDVKLIVSLLQKRGRKESTLHRKVSRPWGWYDSIGSGERFQVKRIMVKPGASLSLQMHHHRSEHWIVVSGTAEVTVGDKTVLLTENQSTFIPLGQTHRLHNPGKLPLELIEVQSGSYLGEDDIVRFEDKYGRA